MVLSRGWNRFLMRMSVASQLPESKARVLSRRRVNQPQLDLYPSLSSIPDMAYQKDAAIQLQETVADAHEVAAAQIAQRFRSPQDFARLMQLRRQIMAEKASVDAQLKAAVQSQVDDAERALAKLSTTRDDADSIAKNLETVDRLSSEAQSMVSNYPKIKKISRTHRNFLATKEHMEQFQSLNERVAKVADMLTEQRRNLLGPAENLLPIHYTLVHLEAFRNATMERSRGSSADVVLTLQVSFPLGLAFAALCLTR